MVVHVGRRRVPVKSGADWIGVSASRSSLKVYQEKLGAAWDSSVTIVAVGHLTVLLQLLESPGGKDLVASKVRHLVVMGGTLGQRDVPEWVRRADSSRSMRNRACMAMPTHATHTIVTCDCCSFSPPRWHRTLVVAAAAAEGTIN